MIETLRQAFPEADFTRHPCIISDHHLRFELGGDYPNRSELRVEQAVQRASCLFGELFAPSSELTILIDDYDDSGQEILSSLPRGVISTVIRDYPAQYETIVCDGCKTPPVRRIFTCSPAWVDHRTLFRYVANTEQGRTPRINQRIYFFDVLRGIGFFMYDDRGCLIFFADRKSYREHRHWRVEWQVND